MKLIGQIKKMGYSLINTITVVIVELNYCRQLPCQVCVTYVCVCVCACVRVCVRVCAWGGWVGDGCGGVSVGV